MAKESYSYRGGVSERTVAFGNNSSSSRVINTVRAIRARADSLMARNNTGNAEQELRNFNRIANAERRMLNRVRNQ